MNCIVCRTDRPAGRGIVCAPCQQERLAAAREAGYQDGVEAAREAGRRDERERIANYLRSRAGYWGQASEGRAAAMMLADEVSAIASPERQQVVAPEASMSAASENHSATSVKIQEQLPCAHGLQFCTPCMWREGRPAEMYRANALAVTQAQPRRCTCPFPRKYCPQCVHECDSCSAARNPVAR